MKKQITIKVFLQSPSFPLTLFKYEDEKRTPWDGPAPFIYAGGEGCLIAPRSSPCPSSHPGGTQLSPPALEKEARRPGSHGGTELDNTLVRLEMTAFHLLLFPQIRVLGRGAAAGYPAPVLGIRGHGMPRRGASPSPSHAHRGDSPSINLCPSPKASGAPRGGKEGSGAAGSAAGSPRLLGVETQNNTNRKHIGD